MSDVSLVRLLSMVVSVALEELHSELAARGHAELRPAHGYALNAVLNGYDTASTIGPQLGMTKQGAAKLLRFLEVHGYVTPVVGNNADARSRPVELTGRGRAVIDLSVEAQGRIEAGWAALVGDASMAQVRAVLEQVVTSRSEPPAVRPAW